MVEVIHKSNRPCAYRNKGRCGESIPAGFAVTSGIVSADNPRGEVAIQNVNSWHHVGDCQIVIHFNDIDALIEALAECKKELIEDQEIDEENRRRGQL